MTKSKFNKVACIQCAVLLDYYWLRNGLCNGCRNPHLIVTAVVES